MALKGAMQLTLHHIKVPQLLKDEVNAAIIPQPYCTPDSDIISPIDIGCHNNERDSL